MRYAAGINRTATTATTMPAIAPVARPVDAGAGVALGVTVAVGDDVETTVLSWVTVLGTDERTIEACVAATMGSGPPSGLLFPVGAAASPPGGAGISDP